MLFMLITNYEDGNNNVNIYSSRVLLQMTSYMLSRKFNQHSGIKIEYKGTHYRPADVWAEIWTHGLRIRILKRIFTKINYFGNFWKD
jgi:hypothetical protein